MNLTLNEKLRFQKQAGIITESQYKKLLKENQDNYLDGVDGREFEKKEIKDWFRTMILFLFQLMITEKNTKPNLPI